MPSKYGFGNTRKKSPYKMGKASYGMDQKNPIKKNGDNEANLTEDVKKAFYHENMGGIRPGGKAPNYKKYGPGTEYEAAHKRIGRTGSELTEMFNSVTKDD